MDSPSDLSPNAPPAGFDDSFKNIAVSFIMSKNTLLFLYRTLLVNTKFLKLPHPQKVLLTRAASKK